MKSQLFLLLLLIVTGCAASKKTTGVTLNFLEKETTSKLYYAYDKEKFNELNSIEKDQDSSYKMEVDLGKVKDKKHKKIFFAWSLQADTRCVHQIRLAKLMKLKKDFPKMSALSTHYIEGCNDGVLVSRDKMKFVGKYRLKLKNQEYELRLIGFMGEFWGVSRKYDDNYMNAIEGNWDYKKETQTFIIKVDQVSNLDVGLALNLPKEKIYTFKVEVSDGKFVFKANDYSLVKL